MKKSAQFAIILLFFNSLVYATPKIDVVVYGDDSYPPYSYLEKDQMNGIYTVILQKAFSKMDGYRVKIIAIPWKRGLQYLSQGKGFALYPPYYRISERPYIWPYSTAILDEKVVVFCTEHILNQSPRPNWPQDYYGLTIAKNTNFELGGPEFWQAVKLGKMHVEEAKGNRENILKLGLKQCDCYMNDRLAILWEIKQLKQQGIYLPGKRHEKIFEGATISVEQGFLGFTNRDKGKFFFKDDFVQKFNTAIHDMQKTGEIQTIVNQFIN